MFSFNSQCFKPITINVAGKNFGTFDKLFLQELPWWQKLIRTRQRVLDPAILLVDWIGDKSLPNLTQCKERAGIRGIVNCIKARKKLTQEDRDVLYTGRINPIATFSDVGCVIWGNKTLQISEGALNRINVRRLLLQARKLISAVAVRLLFEQNDEKLRQDFLDAVNPILDAIRRDRGLFDFRVTVSSSAEDFDKQQLSGKVYLKPTKALEFIDIEFLITPLGASFEDI